METSQRPKVIKVAIRYFWSDLLLVNLKKKLSPKINKEVQLIPLSIHLQNSLLNYPMEIENIFDPTLREHPSAFCKSHLQTCKPSKFVSRPSCNTCKSKRQHTINGM
ncbi:hypothetical protein AMTRI_Chr06g172940 [Amborella trichopoda]